MQMKRDPAAATEYRAVTKLWADPAAAIKQLEVAGEDADTTMRRVGRTLEAVGEALFYFAEKQKVKVDALVFPEYIGTFKGKKPGKNASSEAWRQYLDASAKEKEAITKHIQEKVAVWVEKKKKALNEASVEYKRIIDLEPAPPPRWVIAAGSRVGEMWGQFVKDFRAAPIPTYMKEDDELRNAYYASLDEASEPQKQFAKGAYETCLGYSVKYQYFDEFSRSCEVWLASNYKAEYHLIDEFRGSPDRVNSALREQGRPIRIGGEPMIAAPTEVEKVDKPQAEAPKK
jgi:hypothetical protein